MENPNLVSARTKSVSNSLFDCPVRSCHSLDRRHEYGRYIRPVLASHSDPPTAEAAGMLLGRERIPPIATPALRLSL